MESPSPSKPRRHRISPTALFFACLLGASFYLGCSSSDSDSAPQGSDPERTGGGASNAGDTDAETGGSNTGLGDDGASTETAPSSSAGCGKADVSVGARTLEVRGEAGDFIISVPSDYSAETAYPLGFAFHGYNRTHAECKATDCAGFQSVMGEKAILVYMKSFTDGWEQEEIRDQNADFFEGVLDLVLDELCVDENRVFIAGTSSGASFSNVLACRFGDRLLASAPVAGNLPEDEGCVGQVAVVAIHGIDDPHVTFESGERARDFFLSQNGCSSTTIPELPQVHAEIRASRDIDETNQKCVDYQGCDAGYPVRWCEHSEGGYDDSTHGWPTAGGQLIWDFVSNL